MSATSYTRNDVALIVTKSGEQTRLSIGTRWLEVKTATLAENLAPWIYRMSITTDPLPHPTVEGYGGDPVTLRRITIDIRDAALAALPWEPAVRAALPAQLTPSDVIVRVAQSHPRARQIPLTFPLRVLELVDNSQAHSLGDLHAAFGGADWSSTMETGVASPRHAEAFVRNRNWPTVDILQWSWEWSAGEDVLSAVPYQPGQETPENQRVYSLAWLEAMTALWQTRLVILEADLTYAPIFRRLAHRLVCRGGPAVLLMDRTAGTRIFYDFFVHDRPLDFILMKYPPGLDVTLFAGGGREDALRFSSIGEALSRPEAVEAIREVAEPTIEVQVAMTPQKRDEDIEEAFRRAMTSVGIDHDQETIDFGAMEETQLNDMGDLVEKHLGDSGYHTPKLADPFRILRDRSASVVVPELVRSVGEKVAAPDFGRTRTKIALPGLDKVAANMRDYRFDDHETGGTIPLAHDVRELRNAASRHIRASRRATRAKAPAERHVNSAFYEIVDGQDPSHLPQQGPHFTPGKTIHLGIQMGPKDELTTTFGPTALLEEVFLWTPELRGVTIEIGVTPLDFELIGEPVQQLWLPQTGSSDFVTFTLQPKAMTAIPGVARLRFALYYRNHLIQSFRMAMLLDCAPAAPNALAQVLGLGDDDAVRGLRWGSRLEYANVASLADPKALPARSLTIIANERRRRRDHREGRRLFRRRRRQLVLHTRRKRAAGAEESVRHGQRPLPLLPEEHGYARRPRRRDVQSGDGGMGCVFDVLSGQKMPRWTSGETGGRSIGHRDCPHRPDEGHSVVADVRPRVQSEARALRQSIRSRRAAGAGQRRIMPGRSARSGREDAARRLRHRTGLPHQRVRQRGASKERGADLLSRDRGVCAQLLGLQVPDRSAGTAGEGERESGCGGIVDPRHRAGEGLRGDESLSLLFLRSRKRHSQCHRQREPAGVAGRRSGSRPLQQNQSDPQRRSAGGGHLFLLSRSRRAETTECTDAALCTRLRTRRCRR